MNKYSFLLFFLFCGYLSAAPVEFRDYINIRPGLSEGALVEKLGLPDYTTGETVRKVTKKERVGNTEYHVASSKEMSWYADINIPYTTIVTIENGKVRTVKREKNNKTTPRTIKYQASPN